MQGCGGRRRIIVGGRPVVSNTVSSASRWPFAHARDGPHRIHGHALSGSEFKIYLITGHLWHNGPAWQNQLWLL